MKKTALSHAIDQVIDNGITVDTSHDSEYLENFEGNWDELNDMKDSIASSVMEFTTQVASITQNPLIMNNLGEHVGEFNKLINLFFSDVNNFSLNIKKLREQHEGKTGPIDNLTEYSKFNHITISYTTIMSELSSVLTPTLGELVLLVTDITNKASESQKLQDLQNPDVVSDVEVKENTTEANNVQQ